MFPAVMSNSTSLSEEASTVSSGTRVQDFCNLNPMVSTISTQHQQKIKKKRNLPGNPDPDAEVIALSPKTLLATNRFVCEICNKGFQRDQNLQLHRRGHNLPWKLKQRNSKENRKRAYVCPEPTCIHHHPSRALGDLTGIKKHFCRKHGEKKWKCDKCSKIYAVQSDWKAHSKTCGTREYRCDCGTLFSRKDSFITHRAFCDALAEESARLVSANPTPQPFNLQLQNPSSVPAALFPFSTQQHVNHHQHQHQHQQHFPNPQMHISLTPWDPPQNPNTNPNPNPLHIKPEFIHFSIPPPVPISSPFLQQPATKALQMITSPFQNLNASTQPTSNAAHLSATALLQKAATVGHVASTMTRLGSAGNYMGTGIAPEYLGFTSGDLDTWQKSDRLTRDFLGLTADQSGGNGNIDANANVNLNVRNVLSFTGGVEFPAAYDPDRDHSLLKPQGFGFAEAAASETWGNC